MSIDASSSHVPAPCVTMASKQDAPSSVPVESVVTVLRANDVLLGRGSGPSQYIGSQRFRKLVETRKAEYTACKKVKEKDKIAKELLDHIHSQGGRFLKLVEGQEKEPERFGYGYAGRKSIWHVVDSKTALEKCKQALRQHHRDKPDERDGGSGRSNPERSLPDNSLENLPTAADSIAVMAANHSLDRATHGASGLVGNNGAFIVPFDPHLLLIQQYTFAFQHRLLMSHLYATNLSQFDRTNLYRNRYPPLEANMIQQVPEYAQSAGSSAVAAADQTTARAQRLMTGVCPSPTVASAGNGELETHALFSLTAVDSPKFTREQEEMERVTLTDKEKSEALSDTFGKMCALPPRQRKRVRRDFNRHSIDLTIQQMRLEIDKIPNDKKSALVEAQAKCRAEEFSDARLERFLRCEGMNAEVCVDIAFL